MDYTYNFTPGTRAVAQQVNTNFADVKNAVDPLQTAVANIETQLTSGLILPDGSVDFTRLQSYKTYTVSNATNATPIVITAVGHGFLTGDKVQISGVGGNTAANGVFTITKTGADTFSLNGSVGNGTYTSGTGTAIIVPVADGNLISKAYLDENAGALKISALGSVSSNITLANNTVTTADISGAITVTLPETLTSGNENVVVLDFSTTSSSSPTINMTSTTKTITAASNASPIVITSSGHGYVTGDKVTISGVGGNTAANGLWVITRVDDNSYSLNNSTGNGTYTSGGTSIKTNFRWSDKNAGKAPTAYSIISGVRNVLVFKTHDNGLTWEAEYSTYGGVETTFIRPNLTENGTMGGTSFAVSGNNFTNSLYMAVDGTTQFSGLGTGGYLIIYNPQPLNVKSFSIQNSHVYGSYVGYIISGSIYGSNDGLNYTFIKSINNSVSENSAVWSVDTSSNIDFYKYYKILVTDHTANYGGIEELTMNAVYIAT